MPLRPSTKRAAGSTDSVPGPSQKRTRFVDEDPVNFAEEVDAQLETSHRRGRIRTEGYESDSSDEGEGVVFSRRPGKEADEDEDMFAIGEKVEKVEGDVGKKKKPEYLRLGDIEGQEFTAQTRSQSTESEEEVDSGDEEDAERKKKAGMGFEISSFHMREEMEEGKFTADGTYVRTFDPHAAHDRWMEGLDEKEIKKARKVHKEQERIQRERIEKEERELKALGGKDQVEQRLVGMLKKGETVLEALQRLGAKAKKNAAPVKKRPNNKIKESLNGTAMAVDTKPSEMTNKAPSDIDEITSLASTLMSLGDTDIYSKTYEELVRSIRRTGNVPGSWAPPSADIKYEFQWTVPDASAPEGQVFGPYSEEEMKSWYNASYFGVAGEKVKVRVVGGEWGSWDDVVT